MKISIHRAGLLTSFRLMPESDDERGAVSELHAVFTKAGPQLINAKVLDYMSPDVVLCISPTPIHRTD